jgi:hypothetical protein
MAPSSERPGEEPSSASSNAPPLSSLNGSAPDPEVLQNRRTRLLQELETCESPRSMPTLLGQLKETETLLGLEEWREALNGWFGLLGRRCNDPRERAELLHQHAPELGFDLATALQAVEAEVTPPTPCDRCAQLPSAHCSVCGFFRHIKEHLTLAARTPEVATRFAELLADDDALEGGSGARFHRDQLTTQAGRLFGVPGQTLRELAGMSRDSTPRGAGPGARVRGGCSL